MAKPLTIEQKSDLSVRVAEAIKTVCVEGPTNWEGYSLMFSDITNDFWYVIKDNITLYSARLPRVVDKPMHKLNTTFKVGPWAYKLIEYAKSLKVEADGTN